MNIAGPNFSNRELSTIALLAALHFAVSYVSRLADFVLGAFLGPFYVFPACIGDELVPSLLLAVAVTLIPRIGTAALSIATVWLLNGIVTGSIHAASSVQVLVSLVIYETTLAAARVTSLSTLPVSHAGGALPVVRTAAALGAANCVALYVQFFVSMQFYKFQFAMWYVHLVALLTGFVCGAIGGGLGTAWAFQLRKVAP